MASEEAERLAEGVDTRGLRVERAPAARLREEGGIVLRVIEDRADGCGLDGLGE